VKKQELVIAKNISEQVYEIILERIISGDYKTGYRIDTTRLVEEFKISRSPVKDAFNRLYGAGIVEISPRRGHYVRKISMEEIKDLFEFRLILEVNAALKGLEAMDEHTIKVFEDIIEEARRATTNENDTDVVNIYHLDSKFHRQLVGLSGSAWISKTHSNIHLLSHAVRTQFEESKERTTTAQNEHQKILIAMKQRNAHNLETAITEHLRNAERVLIDRWEETNQ
jgi:DNA-binding GntR family transcriptional regulator